MPTATITALAEETRGPSTFDSGSIVDWVEFFDASYEGQTTWGARSSWSIWFINNRATNPISPTLPIPPPPNHRCDDVLPGLPYGCTYPPIIPVFGVSAANPTYWRHMNLALNAAVANRLTRTTSSAIVDLNRNRACPGPDANYPWPAGFTCEVYPFNSVYQGAFAQGTGYTFLIIGGIGGGGAFFNCQVRWLAPRRGQTGGYSACMVPNAESASATAALNNFYFYNRVIDGDDFRVALA